MRLPPGELLTDETKGSGFFQLEEYVWLAIQQDIWLIDHWLVHSGSADLAGMIVIDAAIATVREADLM